jgi:hypothetical protein
VGLSTMTAVIPRCLRALAAGLVSAPCGRQRQGRVGVTRSSPSSARSSPCTVRPPSRFYGLMLMLGIRCTSGSDTAAPERAPALGAHRRVSKSKRRLWSAPGANGRTLRNHGPQTPCDSRCTWRHRTSRPAPD